MGAPADPLGHLKTGGLSGVFVTDVPLSRLAQEVYDQLEPYAELDAANGYALRALVEALTKTFVDVDELVRDSEAGDVGWSAAFDANRVPSEGMAWLGQLLGVAIPPGLTMDEYRLRLATASTGLRRGSLATMTAVLKRTLTGNKTVLISERTTDAWHFSIRTRTSETPDYVGSFNAVAAHKPAGLIGDYVTFTGILFQESLVNQATYTASLAAKATYTLRGA